MYVHTYLGGWNLFFCKFALLLIKVLFFGIQMPDRRLPVRMRYKLGPSLKTIQTGRQGGQIGPIFAYWAKVSFRLFFTFRTCPNVLAIFSWKKL
jgi:hypothetical protein